jgi:hypothetical protein
MVWHSPTYSNDDILSTTIHQEPTATLLFPVSKGLCYCSDVTDTLILPVTITKVTNTWRSNDAHLWLWPIYRYIPSQFFLLRRCYGLPGHFAAQIQNILYPRSHFFYYFSRDICRKVFYSSAVLAHFMMRWAAMLVRLFYISFFFCKNITHMLTEG